MKKIVDFCKERYKILIPVMVVFVLLITIYFLYREYKYDNYRNKQEVAVYQYFGGVKDEYTAIVTYNLRNAIVDVNKKGTNMEYNSVPIYYKEENKIIFPSEMNIAMPIQDGMQYRLYKYAFYEKKGETNLIKIGSNEAKEYDYFFLFDGKNLYFFPDEVTLNIGGKEYKKLSAMSYVQVIGGYTLVYYDYEKDESAVIEINKREVTVSSKAVKVNLNERYFMSFDKKILLLSPDDLNAVK